ncbi:MAG: carboxypeptidase M32 [Salinirussus sp.]
MADSYERLLEVVRRIGYLDDAAGHLRWDQEVMMPEGGTPARSKQLAALSRTRHELLGGEEVANRLSAITEADLDPDETAVFREVKRRHKRASRVPDALAERLAAATSDAIPVWEDAKAAGEFASFEDMLAELVELRREYAAAIDPDRDPYTVLFEEYEPYLELETAERVLSELRDGLVELIDGIADSDVVLADPFTGAYSNSAQRAVCEAALDAVGYDRTHGRLDVAPHPFSSGTPYDARVTTRFTPTDPLDALLSTIHEFGHARYTLGLPREHYGTPLGSARNMVIHESQSRLWENHIGRTEAFFEHFTPVLADRLGTVADPAIYYEAANRVDPDNVIRVEADELTYHLHIVLRFEIERDLIRGDLDVSEVPGVWNEKMEQYLGVRPADDGEGCLQDIHWAHGDFGYFPTYSLGSALSAQLDSAVRSELAVDSLVRRGQFEPLVDWLRERIHRHGQRFTTPELIERATGEPLRAEPFLEYAEAKYGELYQLD